MTSKRQCLGVKNAALMLTISMASHPALVRYNKRRCRRPTVWPLSAPTWWSTTLLIRREISSEWVPMVKMCLAAVSRPNALSKLPTQIISLQAKNLCQDKARQTLSKFGREKKCCATSLMRRIAFFRHMISTCKALATPAWWSWRGKMRNACAQWFLPRVTCYLLRNPEPTKMHRQPSHTSLMTHLRGSSSTVTLVGKNLLTLRFFTLYRDSSFLDEDTSRQFYWSSLYHQLDWVTVKAPSFVSLFSDVFYSDQEQPNAPRDAVSRTDSR